RITSVSLNFCPSSGVPSNSRLASISEAVCPSNRLPESSSSTIVTVFTTNWTFEGFEMRKSSTATELPSAMGAVRTFSTLPATPTRAPRCMYRMPVTATATSPTPIANAVTNVLFISKLAHYAHDFFHRSMRGGDQSSIEDVGLQADLALVAVLIKGLH